MGNDQTCCRSSAAGQANELYKPPVEPDACKLFTQSGTHRTDLDTYGNGKRKMVSRGFNEDPNVKIRFITEKQEKLPSLKTPQPSKQKNKELV